MAIIINDNLAVNVGKPIDSKYLNISTPWTSVSAANIGVVQSYRYTGLTVNINGTEYWWKNGITNTDLVLKIPTGGTVSNAVTGATNLGYFSGNTGVQVLPITNLPNTDYNGNYYSLYNYYYRGTDQKIHIGIPSDGIPKRGYVKTTIPVKSWLWNEYTGSGNLLGWILVDGNISQNVGTSQVGYTYYGLTTSYTESGWTSGNVYTNGSDLVISTVAGSLTTGTTLTIGGRPFAQKVSGILNFRTIISDTPTTISITDDEANIHISGSSRLIGGGSGERVTKLICQSSHGFIVNNVIGWSGGTYNKAIADGKYDGEVLGIVSKCYNSSCFDLTQVGYVTGLTSGFTTNCTYFLSDSIAGSLTATEPTISGHISKSVLIADSTSSGWVLPYAGYVISSGSSGGGPLVKNVCLPAVSPYQMTSNDFFVGACCGTSVILPLTPLPGMVAIVADISNCASCAPITVVGSLVGGQSWSLINTDSGSLSYIYNGTKWNVFAFTPATIPV